MHERASLKARNGGYII